MLVFYLIYFRLSQQTFVPIGLPPLGRAEQFVLDDLDSDGQIDVIVAVSLPSQVVWMRNLGNFVFQSIIVSNQMAWGINVGCISPQGRVHIIAWKPEFHTSCCLNNHFDPILSSLSLLPSFTECHQIIFSASELGSILKCSLSQNYSFTCTAITQHTGDCHSIYLSDLYLDGCKLIQ